jgi:hypothetical protein
MRGDLSVVIQVVGCQLQGVSRFNLGEFVAARTLLEEHADPAHPPVDLWSAHFHAARLAVLGLTLALLGYIDQARLRTGEALSLARRIRSAPALAQVLIYASSLDFHTGSPLIHAEELLTLSIEQKFAQWLPSALLFRGLALAEMVPLARTVWRLG